MSDPARSYVISLDNRKARGCGHERRCEILQAARALFLEHGIDGVSTRQIAARVGISQTSLYVYFASKEELLAGLVDVAFLKLIAAMREVAPSPDDPAGYLRAGMTSYIRFGIDFPDEYRLAFLLRDPAQKSALPAAARRRTAGMDAFACLEDAVAGCASAGILRAGEPGIAGVAQALWAALHGLVALFITFPGFAWVEKQRLIALHVDILVGGVVQPAHHGEKPPAAREREPAGNDAWGR